MTAISLHTRWFAWSQGRYSVTSESEFDKRLREAPLPSDLAKRGTRQFESRKVRLSRKEWGVSDAKIDDYGITAVDLHLLNGIIFTEVEFRANLPSGATRSELEAHWDSLYKVGESIEATAYRTLGIDSQLRSATSAPISFAEWKPSETGALDELLSKAFTNTLLLDELRMGSSWNGAVVFLQPWTESNRRKFEFLHRLSSLRWAIVEHTKKRLYDLVASPEAASSSAFMWTARRLDEFQSLVAEHHLSMASADPYFLAHSSVEIEFVKLLERSWDFPDVADEAGRLMSDVERSYRVQIERREARVAEKEQARADLLNKILGWLTIAGVATTSASVADFLFKDAADSWNFWTRGVVVIAPTALFALLVWITLRRASK